MVEAALDAALRRVQAAGVAVAAPLAVAAAAAQATGAGRAPELAASSSTGQDAEARAAQAAIATAHVFAGAQRVQTLFARFALRAERAEATAAAEARATAEAHGPWLQHLAFAVQLTHSHTKPLACYIG